MTLEQGDALLRPVPLFEQARHVAFLSRKLRLLVIEAGEIKGLAAGGRGTTLMGIDPPDVLEQVVPITVAGLRASGIYRNKQAEDILAGESLAPYLSKRARKGRQLAVRVKEPVLSPVL